MKKILFLLTFVSILLSSCSSNDSSSSIATESKIKIDGVDFVPGTNVNPINYVITSFEANIVNGTANSRFFGFQNDSDVISDLKSLQIEVVYPVAQTSINGTYSLTDLSNFTNYAQGAYSIGLSQYQFTSGSVIISDLGNNKYKVEFINNAVLTNFDDSSDTKTITGYYKGEFAVE